MDRADFLVGLAGIHDRIAADVYGRTGKGGRVYCRRCGGDQAADFAECLRSGWPKCCGETMTIDPPEVDPRA